MARARRRRAGLRNGCLALGALCALSLLAVVPPAFAGSGSVCGDGAITGPEQCDDGNTDPGDGCDAQCAIEPCFDCTGEPSSCSPLADDEPCDDLDACTAPDTCQGGTCQSGAPVVCPDISACLVGVCDPISGCGTQLLPNGSPCDDGNPDTGPDTCQAGICEGPLLASCVGRPNGSPCSDPNLCTTGDFCQGGLCISGTPVTCTALDVCHLPGSCNPVTGACTNPPAPDGTSCDDGNLCTQVDGCLAGSCVGGSPVVCTALDQCHEPGICDPGTGVCSNPARPDGTPCDDGDLCTQVDTCQAGACDGSSPVVCEPPGQCFGPGVCDPGTGLCSQEFLPAGTACQDGDACTSGDVCDGSGVCLAGGSPCGDGVLNLQCGEQCDDGNTASGDGCSSGCVIEGSVVQTRDQERCINEAFKRDAAVAKAQNLVARDCVRLAGLGRTDKLGSGSQEQTATACLGNDVRAQVSRAIGRLETGLQRRCTQPDQVPDFGLTPAGNIAAVAQAEPRGLVEDLFGDLTSAVVPASSDTAGAKCQSEVAKRAGLLYDELAKRGTNRARVALRCSRQGPTASCTKQGATQPVGNAIELQLEVLGYLQADPKGKLGKRLAALQSAAADRCEPAATPIPTLLPGACSGAADAAEIASCAAQETRCRYCRNLAFGHALLAACDEFDDGLANASCDLAP